MSLMIARFPDLGRPLAGLVLGAFAALALTAPAAAQNLETFDPDAAYSQQNGAGGIDADLSAPQGTTPVPVPPPAEAPAPDPQFDSEFGNYAAPPPAAAAPVPDQGVAPVTTAAQNTGQTYGEDDLIGAAEGVFGKGAEGLAKLIEDLLKKQGEPNGYIVGREAGGAFIVGARYGSGTLHHKIEGTQPVYWTGPSVGFDVGANAANTFVLVYNLYDTEELFKRFPAGEGQAYFVGGLNASYLRRGDVVLIPIRVGAGLRLGVNAGYMKFSKEQKWMPF
ncbi:DUF1134 domain-containing protein [Porphyrobacter sp. TH134]|uniref:DUF1134 domain-containing protein n=1 Tax=Porphyrobacter sp. TH134 TaxID=2067450 RepID=UPI000C79FDD8|nr:DUF1134 domain-containing protein [Porphyrobacter sp. TH134]PLK23434.1 DUF1134 domain-containing protein [Porphyrobacter sp. TH134]